MSVILVITSLPDPHVEMVKAHISKNVSVVIYDPRDIALHKELTIAEDGINTNLMDGFPLSVWFRKPKFLTEGEIKALGVPSEYNTAVRSLHEEGFSVIYGAYPDSFWVSDPYAIRRAGNKLLQLSVANKIGFKIPKTIFSSSPRDINRFREINGDVVMKPLGLPFAKVEGQARWFYATEIQEGQQMDFEGINTTPMIFQEKIKKFFDLRVTVIGDQVFACKIESSALDWRRNESQANTVFSEFMLKKEVAHRCVKMTKVMNLKFGAFDFAMDTANNLVFLEINPNGQWGFIEEKTDMPLSKAMADLLCQSL